MKQILNLCTITLCVLQLTSFAVEAKSNKPKDSLQTKVSKLSSDQTELQRKEIQSEALTALYKTVMALKYLDSKKPKKAIKALEMATGKLDIVIARDPSLAIVPVDISAKTFNTYFDIKVINQLRDKAEHLLSDGRVQDARMILQDLASEVVITTTSIPLATYPLAIKRAVAYIDKKNIKQAKLILQEMLNTLVVKKVILPLPVLRAQELLAKAEVLTEKKARTKDDNKKLENLLKAAEQEVNLAKAFGYGTQKDIKMLLNEIDKIRNKTEDNKSGKGFFDKIKKKLKSIVNK